MRGLSCPRLVAVLIAPLLVTTPAHSELLSDEACVTLLSTDGVRPPAQDAAARNLQAAPLRAPAAEPHRQTSNAVLDAAAAGRIDAVRLCRALIVDRVDETALLTGYYRPLVPARRAAEPGFDYPLYSLPPPALRAATRAAIDGGALSGRVPVLAWVDPIEAFFIHVQGSAVLDTPEGRMAIGFAGANERPYTSIGGVLVRTGRMAREDVSMDSLKQYLREHPGERDGILHANERYIYFRQVDDAAIGSLGVPLTDERSVAADPEHYPPGTLLFLEFERPSSEVPPRLVFVQDRGSAIVGPGRIDLYVGTGDAAARIAGPLQERVRIYVLRPR